MKKTILSGILLVILLMTLAQTSVAVTSTSMTQSEGVDGPGYLEYIGIFYGTLQDMYQSPHVNDRYIIVAEFVIFIGHMGIIPSFRIFQDGEKIPIVASSFSGTITTTRICGIGHLWVSAF